ncbi:hypothetical protein BVRB_028260 [Beta vulgaris subsp. vulgaris]|uniref:Uncharacterized protein n=1 Tax=Beta vulgaris subsp. vulgaris TaxID=3555 RepID=A0A0J8B1I3_BETVV|nr:hypothetical protein BVRB_028260 [Beta vulgaris subsp. vulgaris]
MYYDSYWMIAGHRCLIRMESSSMRGCAIGTLRDLPTAAVVYRSSFPACIHTVNSIKLAIRVGRHDSRDPVAMAKRTVIFGLLPVSIS